MSVVIKEHQGFFAMKSREFISQPKVVSHRKCLHTRSHGGEHSMNQVVVHANYCKLIGPINKMVERCFYFTFYNTWTTLE